MPPVIVICPSRLKYLQQAGALKLARILLQPVDLQEHAAAACPRTQSSSLQRPAACHAWEPGAWPCMCASPAQMGIACMRMPCMH